MSLELEWMAVSIRFSSMQVDKTTDLSSGTVSGKSGVDTGQESALCASQDGPYHHREWDCRDVMSRPRVAQSAGFSFPAIWRH